MEVTIRHVALIAAAVAALTFSLSARAAGHPPVWFVEGALCVHSGWHYTHHRVKHRRPEYVLWRHGYWRTWKTYGNGEGRWDAANPPYGGGLQMDGQFQANYGSEFLRRYGRAGRWPVAVQILVAYRGWLRQGWGAWPNTSRACGLR